MVFDDMVADMLSDKRLNPIVTELFFKGRKLKIPLVFITHSYFPVQKKYQTKFNTLFRYENCKQKRVSTNRI